MSKSQSIIITQLFFFFAILRCASNDEYSLNSQISCAQNQIKLKNNKCISCGAPGTFTRTKQLEQKCLCNPSQLIWRQEGFCDCGQGKAMTVQGTKITCSLCNSAINSQSKANSYTCNCLNPDLLVWNETLMRCQCPYPQIYIEGICISCDEESYSVGINSKKKGQCQCKNPLFWDKKTQQCKCLKGVIFDKDGEISCVNCGREVNSYSGSALTARQCICPLQLEWIDNVGCVCQDMQLLISGKTPECISCSEDIFSKGISENGKECICINDQFKWSSRKKSCVCLKSSQVPVLNQKQQYVCNDCKNKKKLTTLPIINGECTCVSNDVLIWNSKGHCECLSPQTDIYISFPVPHCISCDQTVFSNGKDIKRNICKCKNNNMIWNKQKSICSCKKNTQVLIFDSYEQPSCYQCENSSKLTRLPVIQGKCSCIDNDLLIWFAEGFCGCPDQINQVYLNRPSPRCITCDQSINADGKIDQSLNTCNCVSKVLIFYNGICDCGKNSAYIVDIQENFICINCLDSKRYLRSKNNSTTCNCLSDDMIWNHQTGSCDCPDNKVFYSKSNVFKCIICKGKNIISTVNENNQANCQCSDNKMDLVISQNNQSICKCQLKNSIVTLEGQCLTCLRDQRSLGVIFGAHQCKCFPGNYWNYKQNSCAPCSDIEYATESINGNGFSCECEALYIWDIVSQQCILRCKQGDSSCLNCKEISQTDRQLSSLKQLFPNTTRSHSNTIQAALQFYQVTNYFTISKYQCGCIEGYIWDQYRLMCLLNTLV